MQAPFPTGVTHLRSVGPDSEGVRAACFVGFGEITPDLLQAVIM